MTVAFVSLVCFMAVSSLEHWPGFCNLNATALAGGSLFVSIMTSQPRGTSFPVLQRTACLFL